MPSTSYQVKCTSQFGHLVANHLKCGAFLFENIGLFQMFVWQNIFQNFNTSNMGASFVLKP